MPEWWNVSAPYLQAAGVVLALLLGAANLAWLIVQARRSKETHAIATEAHGWARERRTATERQAQAEAERLAFWQGTKARVDTSTYPIEIPDGTPPEWVIEGEARGYFQRMAHPEGRVVLSRVKA